jgi:excisionase family DNA binding protein
VAYRDWLGEERTWNGWQLPEPGWIPVREAAAMLGVSRQRVHVLISKGRLKAKPYGRRLLLEQASVLALASAPGLRGGRPRGRAASAGARPAPDGWMLPTEAVQLLGFSRQWVHQLIRRGVRRARKETPHRLVVERASVEAYQARRL